MKTLSLALVVLVLSSYVHAAGLWQDPNGVVWTMVEGRTTHARAEVRCETAGFKLPEIDDLLEAFESGLANPEVNTAFGASVAKMDWAWTATPHPAPSPFFYIVSRWSDSTPVPVTERHFVLCAK